MTKKNGKDALVYINAVNVSGQANEYSLNIGNAVSDASAFGDDWDVDTEGTANWSMSVNGWADLNGSTGAMDTLFATIGSGPYKVLLYPGGTDSAEGYFYGVANTTGLTPSVRRGQTNTFGYNAKGTGALLPFGIA